MSIHEPYSLMEAYYGVYADYLEEGYEKLNVDRMLLRSKALRKLPKAPGEPRWGPNDERASFIKQIAGTHSPAKVKKIEKENRERGSKQRNQNEELALYDLVLNYLLDEGYAEDQDDADALIEELEDAEIEGILDEVTGRGYIEPISGKHTKTSVVNRAQKPGSPAMGFMGRTPYSKNETKRKYVQSLPPTKENKRRLRKLNTGEKLMIDRYRTMSQAATNAAQQTRQNLNTSYEYDTYDLVLEYLLDEGYANSEDAALQIMAHMSEDWVDCIIDEAKQEEGMSDKQKRRIRRQRTPYGGGERGESIRQEWHTSQRGRRGDVPLASHPRLENEPGRRVRGKGYIRYRNDEYVSGTRRGAESPTDK